MTNLLAPMLGHTFASVTVELNENEMIFTSTDGTVFKFLHAQNCCEDVRIEDVIGDLSDLVGSPMLLAEEVSSEDYPEPEGKCVDSYTWTFYRFATVKGTVTVRWLGESNGYYSESVDFMINGKEVSLLDEV